VGAFDGIENAEIGEEVIVHDRRYHTVAEVKNGQGPPPIKTPHGWLHVAHGVRGTASGLRYVLYAFMTALGRAVASDLRAGRLPAGRQAQRSASET